MRQLRATRRRRPRREERVPEETGSAPGSAREDMDELCAETLRRIDEALGVA